jgi:hypothetical protein
MSTIEVGMKHRIVDVLLDKARHSAERKDMTDRDEANDKKYQLIRQRRNSRGLHLERCLWTMNSLDWEQLEYHILYRGLAV